MAHLPSPASASSSTLIVTSLPSKDSLQTDAIDIYPSPHPSTDQPTHAPARKMKPKPALTISTTPPNAMPVNEPKMSSKGFVEPHHGHLPRRSRKGTKAGANVKVEEGKEKEKPELSRGLTTSTVQAAAGAAVGAVTSPVPVSATTAAPLVPRTPTPATSAAAAALPTGPEGEALEDDLFSYSPPKTPPPPQHPYIPRHELLPPTYLTSLRLPATPPPAPLASSSGPLVSTPAPVFPLASAAANVNVNANSPAFATPGSGRATPNLPRRRVSRKTQGRKPSDGQVPVDAPVQDEGVAAERSEKRGHVREAATAFDDTGGGGVDDVGSTSSQTSASPSASAGLGDGAGDGGDLTHPRSRSRSRAHTRSQLQARPTSPTPAPLKLRARSQSRPRLTRHLSALDEHDDAGELGASTPTSARLFVGQAQSRSRSQSQLSGLLPGARSRGVSLPRLRLGESPLRSSFGGAGDHDLAGDVFREERPVVEVAKKTRRKEKKKERGRMCLQEVGRSSGVEVGFLDVDFEGGAREALVEFWGLKGSGNHTARTWMRKVVLRVVDPSASDASSSPAELELPLPDDLPSYIDGQPALSAEQIREGCAFIAEHLSSPPVSSPSPSSSSSSSLPPSSSTSTNTRTTRKKVRILTPVARPEDGMAIALCYLAYYAPSHSSSSSDSSKTKTKTQSILLESLHNYFRDPSDSDATFSLNTDGGDEQATPQEGQESLAPLRPWYETLSPAHLLYMRLLDEVEPRSEARDPRGRETSRAFVPGSAYEEEVDVVGESEEESSDMKTRGDGHGDGEEYAGIRTEWRGVISYEGLVRVDEAGRGRDVDPDHGDVEVNGEEED